MTPSGDLVMLGRTAGTLPGRTTASANNWELFLTRFDS
jgi:hypothetical protein